MLLVDSERKTTQIVLQSIQEIGSKSISNPLTPA